MLPMTQLERLQKEARAELKEYIREYPARKYDLEWWLNKAYQAGRNAAVEYIQKHISERGTYDLNYDDIYDQARLPD